MSLSVLALRDLLLLYTIVYIFTSVFIKHTQIMIIEAVVGLHPLGPGASFPKTKTAS